MVDLIFSHSPFSLLQKADKQLSETILFSSSHKYMNQRQNHRYEY